MYEMCLVHVIAETGEGEQAVRDYISENNARHSGHVGVYRAGRRVNPLQLDELKEIVENWVDTALKLTDKDLKLMRRLAAAQTRLHRRRAFEPPADVPVIARDHLNDAPPAAWRPDHRSWGGGANSLAHW